jgi:hypothetical protein
VRLDPDVVPFGGGDEAWVAAWLRPLDGDAIDAAWLVAMCDVLPPAVFSRTNGPGGFRIPAFSRVGDDDR